MSASICYLHVSEWFLQYYVFLVCRFVWHSHLHHSWLLFWSMSFHVTLHLVSWTISSIGDEWVIGLLIWDFRQYVLCSQINCPPVPDNATAQCNSSVSPCLFNIVSDPCEYHNLAATHPDILNTLKVKLKYYNNTAVPPGNKPWDPAANPKYWGYSWTNWKDFPSPLIPESERNVERVSEPYDLYGDIRSD